MFDYDVPPEDPMSFDPLPADPAPDHAPPAVGVNVTWFHQAGHMDHLVFVDQFKGAWPWQGTVGADPVAYDAQGYPLHTPDKGEVFSKILKRSNALDEIDPFSGMFRIYGQGEGSLRIDQVRVGDVLSGVHTTDLPTETIDGRTYWYVDFDYDIAAPDGTSNGDIRLFLTDITEGDHLRDMALVHHGHLDAFRNDALFAPEFLADLQGMDTLRFMEWSAATKYNKTGGGDWTPTDALQRYVGPDHFTFNTQAGDWQTDSVFLSSAPIETIVALANAVDANPWIALPVDIPDAQARDWAQYVAEMLDPELEVYWEYGNELWNSAHGFDGYHYAEYMAGEVFGDPDLSGLRAVAEWDAYRGPQLFDIIASVPQADAHEVHFVGSMWAHDAPLGYNGKDRPNSYTSIYWTAAQAQAMPDAPSAPADIITDYAVGLYYGGGLGSSGGENASALDYITSVRDDPAEQAEIFARWLAFGTDPDTYVEITPEALNAPMHMAGIAPDSNISVAKLVRADHDAGHDVIADLNQILRLQDDKLQYRGVLADRWTTVMTFDSDHGRSIGLYLSEANIIGAGFEVQGKLYTGVKSGLLHQIERRMGLHLDFVETHGLNFVSYEGGPHFQNLSPAREAIAHAFEQGGGYAWTQSIYYEAMRDAGLDLYTHYMSHNRSLGLGEHWGARDHVGQSLDAAPKAAWLLETATAARDVTTDTVNLANLRLSTADQTADGIVMPPGNTPVEAIFRLDPARGSAAQDAFRVSFDVASGAVTDTPTTDTLHVVLRAFGGGTQEIYRGDMTIDGSGRFVLDFDGLAPEHHKLKLVVRRIGSGETDHDLLLSGLSMDRFGA